MSELKAETIVPQGTTITLQMYPKAEADKVIAGLQDKLQKESALLKETREWLIESQKVHKRCADNAVKVIRHSNYKRCVGMAKWCYERWISAYHSSRLQKARFYAQWQKRWEKLAEKFKEP